MTEPNTLEAAHKPIFSCMSSARWRRLALSGAAVGSAAASSTAGAGVVQISQVGNEATSLANNLRADITGDGMADLDGLGVRNNPPRSVNTTFDNAWTFDAKIGAFFDPPGSQINLNLGFAGHAVFGTGAIALENTFSSRYFNTVGGNDNSPSKNSSRMIPITFSDSRINGGATTNGFLEVRAVSTSKTSHTVRLMRLVFNDASTAAPTGAGTTAGSTAREFGSPVVDTARLAKIAALKKKIAVLSKQLKKAKKKKQKAKIRSLSKTIRRFKSQLAAL